MALVVVPGNRVGLHPDGSITLTRKFIDGMAAYARLWDGPLIVCMRSGPASDDLGLEAVDPKTLPFRLLVDVDLADVMAQASIVLALATRDQAPIAAVCGAAGVPCVYVTENTLHTRWQMVCADTANPLKRLRRGLWEWRTERIVRQAIGASSGVQCNGTPTHEAYRGIAKNALLFFDTRSSGDSLATDAELSLRHAAFLRGGPLRLVFSGRLIRIKGADHLVEVARALRRREVDFRMTICGDGDLAASIRASIGDLPIEMTGTLDFESGLQPLLKSACDLFVSCHRQGDPSCTYLETMAAGVPIVSYDNEAFAGIRAASQAAGWSVPMNRPDEMAACIAGLGREEIVAASWRAIRFARLNAFEAVFAQRIEHLRRLARPVEIAGRREREPALAG